MATAAVLIALPACAREARANGAEPAGNDPSNTHFYVLEVGGPVDALRLDRATDSILHDLVEEDSGVRVLVADGPNAAAFDMAAVPGTTSSGELDTRAVNHQARSDEVARLRPELRSFLVTIFEAQPDLDDGRDLVGGVERALRSAPDTLTVVFTSGGVQRTSEADWLAPDAAMAIDVEVPDGTKIDLIGLGDIPAPEPGPPLALTDRVYDAWSSWCNCEVG